ncbi:hypothetical protein DEO72_LG8g1645 [Vigna unguiculata]|uniref:Uncharacterized protein n=1 Tax=Vigna unguiculata TaxID=3917 RepID=A0A4D6MPZ4_VIGUN|nr:hypothetical protein DEO72_LG8g1645 [Vigna unguiculata]
MVTIWLHWRLRRHYWRTMVYASSARSGFATRWLMLSVVEDNQLWHGSGGCTRSAGVLTWSLSGNGALQAPIWFAAVAEIA